MSPEVTTLRGQLTLTIGDTPAVNLGYIDIPMTCATCEEEQADEDSQH